jgi:hypothetical protein
MCCQSATAALAKLHRPIGVVAKMQMPRRNNVNSIPGAPHQTSAFYGDRGWKPRKSSPPPVEGEPFIDQAWLMKNSPS